MKATILVTAAGGPGAVNMTRSLMEDPELTLVGCDASEYYVHLALTEHKALVPRCADLEGYVGAINALCDRFGVDLIMPNNSLEAHVLSSERDRLRAQVFLPPVETLDKANSKWSSWQLWRDAGLPVPATWLLDTPDDLRRVFADHAERPIWVRGAGIPGKGIGGAALPCRTLGHAEAWLDFYDGWGGMMASEYLPGDNLTWIGVWQDGQLITSASRRRLAYVIAHVSPSGITGAPSISETIHHPELNAIGPRAALTLDPNLTGVSFLDFKCDASGAPRITEMNAGRFGTTHHFYTRAGLNLPLLYVRLALGLPLEQKLPQFDAVAAGLTWVRTLDAGPALLQPGEVQRQAEMLRSLATPVRPT
ncbi:MAG: biotin carboxylase [Myxococcota bacterium]|jgi:biotin carboxylase